MGDIEQEVHESKPPRAKKSQDRSPAARQREQVECDSLFSDDPEDDSSLLGTIAFFTVAGAVSSPIWAPRAITNDHGFGEGYFRRYPFHHDAVGFLAESQADTGRRRYWFVRTGIDVASDFDTTQQLRSQLLLDTTSRFGLDAEIKRLDELQRGQRAGSLWLGDINLLVRFAQSERVQMRTGIGLNWLAHDVDEDVGFNFTYSGDWFPCDPWIVSAAIDWGKIGRSDLFHFQSTVGLHYHRSEVYTGVDYLNLEGTQIPSLVAGIRFWL